MGRSLISTLYILTLVAGAVLCAKQLPKDFKRCSRLDPQLGTCLVRAFEVVAPKIRDGIPRFKLPPMDPLRITKLTLSQGSGGPVSLHFSFENVTIRGMFESFKVLDVGLKYDENDMFAKLYFERAVLEADYDMNGKVLVLPIKGKGWCNVTIKQVTADVRIKGVPVVVDGRTYNNVTDYRIDMRPTVMESYFDGNIFQGIENLGNTTNRIVNDNWQLFYEELKPTLNEALGIVYKEFANKIFLSVPYDDIFPEKL